MATETQVMPINPRAARVVPPMMAVPGRSMSPPVKAMSPMKKTPLPAISVKSVSSPPVAPIEIRALSPKEQEKQDVKFLDRTDYKVTRSTKRFKDLGYEEKKKVLEYFGEVDDEGFTSPNLEKFIDSKDHKVYFTQNGEIVIKGLEVKAPDYTKEYREFYQKQLKEIKDLNCDFKNAISNWSKISTVTCIALVALIFVVIIVYGIYRFVVNTFFSSD